MTSAILNEAVAAFADGTVVAFVVAAVEIVAAVRFVENNVATAEDWDGVDSLA